jgi:hypothetical protein
VELEDVTLEKNEELITQAQNIGKKWRKCERSNATEPKSFKKSGSHLGRHNLRVRFTSTDAVRCHRAP